jgi:hypothetical protein
MTRNVVLIVLDSVRKDYFDEFAPRLQGFSDGSFERCYAASSWSAPSHASMITGELPSEHGIHVYNTDFAGLAKQRTFFSELPDHRAVGASTNLFAGSAFSFDRFFDEFTSFTRLGAVPGGVNLDEFAREHDGPGRYLSFVREAYRQDELVPSVINGAYMKFNDLVDGIPIPRVGDYGARALCRELRRLADDEPFFMFANYMDVHEPLESTFAFDSSTYDVPNSWSSNQVGKWKINNADSVEQYADYRENYRELYAAAVEYLDHRVSEFVSDVQEQTERETTFVITADHGENLSYPGEEYLFGHSSSLSEALLHVPLVVVNPPGEGGWSEDALCSHLDLPELLTSLADGELPDVSRKRVPAERVGIGLSQPDERFDYWNRMLRCGIEDDTKFVWDSLGNRERFQLDSPSREEQAAADVELPEWATDPFDVEIRTFKREASSAIDREDFDEATREHLADLGYL